MDLAQLERAVLHRLTVNPNHCTAAIGEQEALSSFGSHIVDWQNVLNSLLAIARNVADLFAT
jgi:hypothetical protein